MSKSLKERVRALYIDADQVLNQVVVWNNQTEFHVLDQVEFQVYDQVRNQVYDQVRGQVRGQVLNEIEDQVIR